MRLKSITLKGFKSFPDRTHLDFGPGVSVVVGPNGSGKSNITDAVLWAMGEQSPLAVRGSSMQDVIFGGGHGVQARSEAEVEIVLDNDDGTVELPVSEISIARRLDRTGEGGYRLNGARCRLTDIIEVLSDTGLGKETHSIISQGRVDAIVTSKPRERRMLIEEAAGLGKHRKRRRRAQLKLEHTQENLDRALDVEREARSRLRPLKRQAEAAELHERLERQTLEARLTLARDAARDCREQLALAESAATEAREQRAGREQELQKTVERRGAAERALAERAERHDVLGRRLYGLRSAHERLALRGEQAEGAVQALRARGGRAERELAELERPLAEQDDGQPATDRVSALEAELAQLDAAREHELGEQLGELNATLEGHVAELDAARARLAHARAKRERADGDRASSRERLAAAEETARSAGRRTAQLDAELAAANEFLRSHARVGEGAQESPPALGDELRVEPGHELALAAALGGRLDAALVSDVAGAQRVLDGAGPDGGTALLADAHGRADAHPAAPDARDSPGAGDPAARAHAGADASRPAPDAPAPGARRLLELLSGPPGVLALARRLLADAWVVERLEELPRDFTGIAATRQGRVWFAEWGEVRQLNEGASERVLARRSERDRLLAAIDEASALERDARAALEQVLGQDAAAERDLAAAERALHEAAREEAERAEQQRRTEWLIEQRRATPGEGPLAVRRAELEGELAAERRQLERRERESALRAERVQRIRAQLAVDLAAVPLGERLCAALLAAREAVESQIAALEDLLAGERLAGEEMAGELRACAAREAELQGALRAAGERVTDAEVAAQRARDRAAEAELELEDLDTSLGRPGASDEHGESPSEEALPEERKQELTARLERLARRREQLGPVNPLAQSEYADARAHVEELEEQRADLETALRELRAVIRETDRQIERTFEETFAAAARNFEELAGDVFPGGSGRLRLVREERAPRAVLGGQALAEEQAAEGSADGGEDAADAELEAELRSREGEEELPGVEIEITPAGKSTKRLSLLSGGEKSMTALAFVFAVFLARPCPFYILDEVEAALDDANLDRFLALLRRYSQRAQFVVITHQKRTMEAADWLYGVSMGGDGVSKVLSRKLPAAESSEQFAADSAEQDVAQVA